MKITLKNFILMFVLAIFFIMIYFLLLTYYNGIQLEIVSKSPLTLSIRQYGLRPDGVYKITISNGDILLWDIDANSAYKRMESSSYVEFELDYGVLPDGFKTARPALELPDKHDIKITVYYSGLMPILVTRRSEFILHASDDGFYSVENKD